MFSTKKNLQAESPSRSKRETSKGVIPSRITAHYLYIEDVAIKSIIFVQIMCRVRTWDPNNRLGQKDWELKASLSYVVSLRLAKRLQRPSLKKEKVKIKTLKIKVTLFCYGTLNQQMTIENIKIFKFKYFYLSNPLFKTVPYKVQSKNHLM